MSNWELALSYGSILASVAVVAVLFSRARQEPLVNILKGLLKEVRLILP